MAKFKLNYNPTYSFMLADIFDAGDSSITFESKARIEPEWAELCRQWVKLDDPEIEMSLQIVGMGIVKVTQDEGVLLIANTEDARQLMDAVEAGAPGYGPQFIEHLVIGHWNLHFKRLDERLGKRNGFDKGS